MIYDVESLIDYEKIKNIIEKHKNKKIICFGGGTAAIFLTNNLLINYDVECFIDNNSKLWGTEINGIQIVNPEIVKEKEKGTFIILILSRYVINIRQQLISYDLEENKDFLNIYDEFIKYFRVKKFDCIAHKFLDFINRIPNDLFKNIEEKHDINIGIVCKASILLLETWYPLAQYLILKYSGYKVTLIVDNLRSFDDFTHFDGQSDIAKVYSDFVIERMKEKVGKMRIKYIDSNNKASLVKEDIDEVKRLAQLNVLWQDSKTDNYVYCSAEEKRDVFEKILLDNMESIKYFFAHNKFDTINVLTALHKSRGLYMWEGIRYNMRVSNYDAGNDENTLYETNFPSAHSNDVKNLIDNNKFTKEELNKIIELSKDNFKRRMNSTIDNIGYNYQLVSKVKKDQKFYDIIIPLNISWDAAALGLDRVFRSYTEWVIETVKYIVNNTNASVMIREHPAQEVYKEYNFIRLEKEIKEICDDTSRVYYCNSYEEVNTYKMIEKCKIVLPYSSTIGIEAAILGKKVIVHTNCYYSNMNFVMNANTKQEYFKLINIYLNKNENMNENIKKEAYLAYYYQMKHAIETNFTEANDVWMNLNFCDLLNMKGVKKIIQIIGQEESGVYLNIKEELDILNNRLGEKIC